MIAALKVQQQTQAPKQDKPENTVQSEYEQAVAQAEKELGIKPGDGCGIVQPCAAALEIKAAHSTAMPAARK